jgi:hypothetical protein
MTREEILTMKPGRELDGLIHWKVFNCTHKVHVHTFTSKDNPYKQSIVEIIDTHTEKPIPHYSRSIAAAWEVVEKIVTRMNDYPVDGFKWSGPLYKPNTNYLTNEGYPLGTVCWYVIVQSDNIGRHAVCAETAPEAICRAALFATLGGD